MSDPVIIREFNPAVPGEENLILSTWLRDLHDADPSGLPVDLWFAAHRRHIQNVLADSRSTVLIAAASDHPEEILGYVAGYKEESLEWVFVKKGLRNQGIARRLLVAAKLPPGIPSRFMTALGKIRLSNPCRSRLMRKSLPGSKVSESRTSKP